MLSEIASRVRDRRKASDLTQAELARRAGVSRIQIDRLENQRLADIGIAHLSRILAVLGLELRLAEQNRGRPTLDDLRRESLG